MNLRSGATAALAFGRRLRGWSAAAGDGGADLALKRHARWATPAAAAFATLAAAAAAAFRDRPTVFGALAVLLTLAMVPLLAGGLARRLRRPPAGGARRPGSHQRPGHAAGPGRPRADLGEPSDG